jgi:isopentenyl phosphate kinase
MQVRELNQILSSEMEKVKVECESVIPSNTMKIDNEDNILNFPKSDFDKILSKGKVALTFGDVVKNNENDIRILSGDTILLKLSQIYNPKKTFFIMEYPGVVKGNLNSDNLGIYEEINSELINKISIVDEKNRPDVTGGLLKKIECALEISKYSDCWISGLDNLNKCINGYPEGTRVVH